MNSDYQYSPVEEPQTLNHVACPAHTQDYYISSCVLLKDSSHFEGTMMHKHIKFQTVIMTIYNYLLHFKLKLFIKNYSYKTAQFCCIIISRTLSLICGMYKPSQSNCFAHKGKFTVIFELYIPIF
jgi:hypothetical protein